MSDEKQENIVKATAKRLGMTYRELGDAIGYTESAIKTAISTDKVSEPMEKSLEMYLENIELKAKLQAVEGFKQNLKDFLAQ